MNHNADAAAGLKELEVLRKYFPQCFHSDGEFDIEAFKAALPGGTTITDETSGQTFTAEPFPPFMRDLIAAGGLATYLSKKGAMNA